MGPLTALELTPQAPVTLTLAFGCIVVALMINFWNFDTRQLCNQYDKLVVRRQFWRLASSCWLHEDAVTLVFNLFMIWSNRSLELYFGSWEFFRRTFLLMALSDAITMFWLHVYFVSRSNASIDFRKSHWLGFSGILIGWTVVQCNLATTSEEDSVELLGLFLVPVTSALMVLFALMLIVSLHMDLLNSISAVAAGYFVALDVLPPYITFCIAQWWALGVICGKERPSKWRMLETDEQQALRRSREELLASNTTNVQSSSQSSSESLPEISIAIPARFAVHGPESIADFSNRLVALATRRQATIVQQRAQQQAGLESLRRRQQQREEEEESTRPAQLGQQRQPSY